MNYKKLFETAMLAGEIMSQSGAETLRVEDTMMRILRISGLQSMEVYATTTGIIATLTDSSIEPITGVKRITNRSNNLSRINEVNNISRKICDSCITIETAYEMLLVIKNQKIYSDRIIAIATVIAAVGFAGLFGGNIADCLIAAVNGAFIVLVGRFSDNRVGSAFMVDATKSFIIAFLTLLCTNIFQNTHMEIIIIGSIMPLVPGIPITNAIRDTLQGDYNSGTARAVEAFVISLQIAVGVGFGVGIYHIIERMF